MLTNKDHTCEPLIWTSYEASTDIRSVLENEMLAFFDAFDMAYTIETNLQIMTGSFMTLDTMTDSLPLFDVLIKASETTEKGSIIIDLQTVKASYRKRKLHEVGYVRSRHNIADALTRVMKSTVMYDVLY